MVATVKMASFTKERIGCTCLGSAQRWIRKLLEAAKLKYGKTSRMRDRREISPLLEPTRSREVNTRERASAPSGRNDKFGLGRTPPLMFLRKDVNLKGMCVKMCKDVILKG